MSSLGQRFLLALKKSEMHPSYHCPNTEREREREISQFLMKRLREEELPAKSYTMVLWFQKVFLLIFLFHSSEIGVFSFRKQQMDQISEMKQQMDEMYEIMKQESRLNEIKNIIQMEKMLDLIQGRVEEIIMKLEMKSENHVYRHLLNMIETLNSRMENLETRILASTDEVKQSTENAMRKISEIYEAALNWENALDIRMRKILNIIGPVYEMSKNVTTMIDNERLGGLSRSSPVNNQGFQFLSDQIEEMKQKLKEDINVLSVQMRTNGNNFRSIARDVFNKWDLLSAELQTMKGQCQKGEATFNLLKGSNNATEEKPSGAAQTDPDDDYDYGESYQPETSTGNSRQRSLPKSINKMLQNLTKTHIQIRNELSTGMQIMSEKLNSVLNISNTLRACKAEMTTSSSTLRDYQVESVQREVLKKEGDKEVHCNTKSTVTNPKSCAELRHGGATCDGVYIIFPMHKTAAKVYCDMTTEGGGWTVILRRGDFGTSRTTFNRTWRHYKNGFGNPEQEYWIGNEPLHHLTMQDQVVLRIGLEAFDGEQVNITYGYFSINNEDTGYRISIGGLSGNTLYPGSDFISFNNRPFGTHDVPNQSLSENCAKKMKGGWWFKHGHCFGPVLTGKYYTPKDKRERWDGIQWPIWKGDNVLQSAEMKIRPHNFRV